MVQQFFKLNGYKRKETDAKYFIGYKASKKTPFIIILPQMKRFLNELVESRYMSFVIKNGKLLSKYESICNTLI